MYDTVEKCDERLAEISATAEKLGAETAYTLLRLQLEEEFLYKLRKVIHEREAGSSEPKEHEDENEPELLKIIRQNPGLSTREISERVGINGQSLSNRLGDLQKRGFIGNGGTKRPGGARWFMK